MSTGAWFLVVTLALAAAFGGYRALTDGTFRGTRRVGYGRVTRKLPGSQDASSAPVVASVVEGTPWVDDLGEQFTLLQFSSAFCAPCRATRRVLGEVVEVVPGVAHIEVDAEQHLDVVRRLGILRTPTTLILDSAGAEITRATGAPTKQQVLGALGAA
ncbi:MAG: putative thioredoxin [Marmoricola sp.]|nr:putative thioredoxin [Marmoricola sp.]